VAIFKGEEPFLEKTIRHSSEELAVFATIMDQLDFRQQLIEDWLKEEGFSVQQIAAVVARGGALKPIAGGTYSVNDEMIADLKESRYGRHASNLGASLANAIAGPLAIPAFIVDPVAVDELQPLARYSGLPELPRRSVFHALNQKAVARVAARDLGTKYDQINLIVAHMGGGISVGVHVRGRVIDVNNGLDGEGPLSPERAGTLPVGDLIKLCFSGQYTMDEMYRRAVGRGGLVAYLGTNDVREIEKRIDTGDKEAAEILEAMAYQVAKEIGALVAVVAGDVDAIVLTGGLAYSERFVGWIRKRVESFARVMVYPGEDEMRALVEGALRVLRGEEAPREYTA
jgi:butyrate kinase